MKAFSISGWSAKQVPQLPESIDQRTWEKFVKGYVFSGIIVCEGEKVYGIIFDEDGFGAVMIVKFDCEKKTILLRKFRKNRVDSVDYVATFNSVDDCWHCRPKGDENGSTAVKFVLRELPAELFVREELTALAKAS